MAKVEEPIRLWPGVVAVALQWLAVVGLPFFAPETRPLGVLGGPFGWLAIVVWWAFFSRAPRAERWGGVILMIVALGATSLIGHRSILGLALVAYTLPVVSLAFVAWAVVGRRLSDRPRRAAMVATVLLACGMWTLVRSEGATGDMTVDFAWRWTVSPEQRLLAQEDDEPAALPPAPATETTEAEWPGFRGEDRNGVISDVRIETDWSASPPVELWRRPIGPGWSSFAVRGDLLYTQEQRGDDEVVTCYDATNGEPVWRHRDAVRFWEANGGAGPRATPTSSGDRVYTFGATGILNALDAGDGTVVWSRDVASDTGARVPAWGFASSPLVVGDLVIVNIGALAAYDLASGDPRWSGPGGDGSFMHLSYYSSPHLLAIDGVEQILQMSPAGTAGLVPSAGTPLWEHPWSEIVQPALTADGDVLIGTGTGMRRLAVSRGPGGWNVEERWTSAGLKPGFNDFVVHDGHAYGFDGAILACIDLEDGKRRWKGGRYGHGQLVLLAEQDLLLVVSEQGRLALVGATPDRFTELARFPAIEGKTWNHPVLARDLLLVRNGQEMVAFRLALARG